MEYIQTDIWVRFQRMMRQRGATTSAPDDTHGTPGDAAGRKGRHHPQAADRPRVDRAQARFRQFHGVVRQLLQHRLRREQAALREDLPGAEGQKT
ncbi:class I tRNA ligase family protein [Cupriavidus basilensis]